MASKQPAVQGIFMKSHRISAFFAVLLVLWLGAAPAWGVSKEMVQLQTQVQQLQEQMTAMQRSFDERMGVMKNLVEQDTDAVNKVANALNGLQTTLQKQQSEGGSKADQLSGQIQSLNDTLDELKARLAKVSKQRSKAWALSRPSNRRSSRPRRKLRLRMFSTTMPCAITTAARMTCRCRNFRTTSSSIPTPIWLETPISIWERSNFVKETTSRRRRATTPYCRTFPGETKPRPRN